MWFNPKGIYVWLLMAAYFVTMVTPWPVAAVSARGADSIWVHMAFQPNDPDMPRQNQLGRIHVPAAWDLLSDHTRQRDVVIAVLDTGVDIDHPDLAGNIWNNTDETPGDGLDNDNNSYVDDVRGWDFITSSSDPRPKLEDGYVYEAVHHGTVVAGILAAITNNGLGIAGAAHTAKIMPLRVLDGKGGGNTLVLTQAIEYAIENGADVINLSLVGNVRDPGLSAAIHKAYQSGIAVVAASGNQEKAGVDLNESPHYPVCEQSGVNEIIGVAAVDELDRLATFSNYGSNCIDIAAPGTSFFSTLWFIPNNSYFSTYYSGGWTGTSVATPLVSATLAMMKQVAPNLTLAERYHFLLNSARSLQAANSQNFTDLGSGMLDAERAVAAAIDGAERKPVRFVMAAGKGYEPTIMVKSKEGTTIQEFLAYDRRFKGGIFAAVGDVDGDTVQEILTAPMAGGGPHVRIFDMQGHLKGQFMAYAPNFNGGVSIGTGDLDGDGKAEIITTPLSKGGPHVRVFDIQGNVKSQFMAYDAKFRGGVETAVGDLDGDKIAELITVPMAGGGPHVRIFDLRGGLKGQFMAYAPDTRNGLSLAVGDVDSDGNTEIVTSLLATQGVSIRMFGTGWQEENRFLVYPDLVTDEHPVQVEVFDYTGDGRPDIMAYPITPGGQYYTYDYYGKRLDQGNLTSVDANERGARYHYSLIR